MEELYESGKCRAIGVSNFLERHLEGILAECRVVPHVNQCEFHPTRTQKGYGISAARRGLHFREDNHFCGNSRIKFLSVVSTKLTWIHKNL